MKNKNNELSKLLLDEVSSDKFDLTKINQLIDDGADVNYQSERDGSTALMIAAEKKQLSIVEILLENDADIELKNNAGMNVFKINRDDDIFFAIRKKFPIKNSLTQPLPIIQKEPLTLDELYFEPDTISGFEPGATDEQIAELEKHCGHELPEKYKIILKKYNHGYLRARGFSSKDEESGFMMERHLSHFFVLDHDKDKPSNIWWQIKHCDVHMGPSSIPLGSDGNDGTYFIKWVDGIPQVWYLVWDDEDDSLEERELISYVVMDSFDDLLEALYVEEE